MEEYLSYEEIKLIILENNKRVQAQRKWDAGVHGIKLDDSMDDETQQAIDRVRQEAARILSADENALEREELAEFGIAFETV